MFTGLIEEAGKIKHIDHRGAAARLQVEGPIVSQDLKVDDSIAVNGVCLTAVKVTGPWFDVDAVDETLRKTTLGKLKPGAVVNLERCLRPSDRIGGHIVQGHVDSIGRMVDSRKQDAGRVIWIELVEKALRYVIEEGSITINGVSLTVAKKERRRIAIALIPHTLEKTNLGLLHIGDEVNVEVDLIGKYVENLLKARNGEPMTEAWIKQFGYK